MVSKGKPSLVPVFQLVASNNKILSDATVYKYFRMQSISFHVGFLGRLLGVMFHVSTSVTKIRLIKHLRYHELPA